MGGLGLAQRLRRWLDKNHLYFVRKESVKASGYQQWQNRSSSHPNKQNSSSHPDLSRILWGLSISKAPV